MEDSDIAESKFVDDLPRKFRCSICFSALIQPQLVNCCETRYCKVCLRKWRRINNSCPTCRSKDFSFMDMPRALMVHCPNAPHGCTITLALRDCPAHLSHGNPSGCQYVTLPCPNNCGETKLFRAQMEAHCQDLCPNRPISCSHCGKQGGYEYITGKHSDECKSYPVQCPQECGVTVARENLEVHETKCSLQPIACIFQGVGCNTTTCRRDVNEHLKSEMADHLTQLLSSHTQLLSAHTTLQNNHSLLEKKYGQLSEEHNSLQDKHESLQQAHQSLENKIYSVGRVVEAISPQTPSTALALQQLNTMLVDTSKRDIGDSFTLVLSSCAERGSHKFLVDMIHFQLDWLYMLRQLFIKLYWIPPSLPHISKQWSCDFIMKLRPICTDAGQSQAASVATTQNLAVICCGKPQIPVKSTPTEKMVLVAPQKIVPTHDDVMLILTLQHHSEKLSYLPPASHGEEAGLGKKTSQAEAFTTPFTMAQVFNCPCRCHKKGYVEEHFPAKHSTRYRWLSKSAKNLEPIVRCGTN